MRVKGCGFYRRGFMKEQSLVRGAYVSVVYASLCPYEGREKNAWRQV